MPKKVLICDDEPYIRESLSYVAREAGYEVSTAEDGEEAVQKAVQELPDLIFLDLMMPRRNGFEVCQALRANESTKDIHIIILTARGQDVDRVQGGQAGANEYFTKPFSPRKLRQRMHEILDD
ncbi:MAG: response regulator [Acidobacteria bacterium]|nr:MAG: response regulator [Acidobacteriota bacterium]